MTNNGTKTLEREKESRVADSDFQAAHNHFQQVMRAVETILFGHGRELKAILVVLLAGGHALLEGVPGVAKTQLVKDLSDALGLSFKRIQFTPDRLPSELTGWHDQHGEFVRGPLFANFVLGDEINRASPKTQAAMLEAMGEGQVTVDRTTYSLDKPFLVVATQNPIEFEGTYDLPEAQLDRFLMKVDVDRVNDIGHRRNIVRSNLNGRPHLEAYQPDELGRFIGLRSQVRIEDVLIDKLGVVLDRIDGVGDVAVGPGERALIGLVRAGQACALLDGEGVVSSHHVMEFGAEILRHRVWLKDQAHLNPDGKQKVEEIVVDGLRALLR
jgi:MoxR-like ATPase